MLFAIALWCSFAHAVNAAQNALSKSTGPPPFFLKDPVDGLCLAGSTFKRCSISTLWYVVGKPGNYQIHHRLVDEDDEEGCLDRVQCHLEESDVKVANCNHCGAKKWNIVGETDTGFALTEDDNKNCLKRVGNQVSMILCDKGYSIVTLQFASRDEVDSMNSDGAKLVAAAADNDVSDVKNMFGKGIDINSRDMDGITPLIAAATKGNIDIVKYLVANGADVNLFDNNNHTALVVSAMHGHLAVLEFLLKSGADVHIVSKLGVNALWLAANNGHINVVKYLLNYRPRGSSNNNNHHVIDINSIRTADGVSTLMTACYNGHVEIVKALIDASLSDANNDNVDIINYRNKDGVSALIGAIENNSSFVLIEALVKAGAEINVMTSMGYSPLIVASAHGQVDTVQLLLSQKDIELEMDSQPEQVTPLMYAASGGYSDIVKLLIGRGANVNLKHKYGGTALLEAAASGNVEAFNAILEAGGDIHIFDEEGVTPLMSAASQGHTHICKISLERGLDVNKVANSGGTALMYAAGLGHNETTKYLIDHGADVNIIVHATPEYIVKIAQELKEGKEGVEPHKDGVTAVIIAAQEGHLGTVKILVESGADVTIEDDEGMTALTEAMKANHTSIVHYLVEHGPNINVNDVYIDEKTQKVHHLLMDSILELDEDFSLLLIERGANASYVDSDEGNVSVLTQSSYLGLERVVEALIDHGADVTMSNSEGVDALIAAASEGHVNIVKLLVEKGKANINSKDRDGTNALMASAVRGHKDVVKLLIEYIASSSSNSNSSGMLNYQNLDGHTALMFAYNGKNQVVTLLQKYHEYYMKSVSNGDSSDAEAATTSSEVIRQALQSHLEVIQLLLNAGADPNIKDNEGHIALDFDYKIDDNIGNGGDSDGNNDSDNNQQALEDDDISTTTAAGRRSSRRRSNFDDIEEQEL